MAYGREALCCSNARPQPLTKTVSILDAIGVHIYKNLLYFWFLAHCGLWQWRHHRPRAWTSLQTCTSYNADWVSSLGWKSWKLRKWGTPFVYLVYFWFLAHCGLRRRRRHRRRAWTSLLTCTSYDAVGVSSLGPPAIKVAPTRGREIPRDFSARKKL